MDENADGGVVTSVATENATSVTVSDDRFEVADGNLKLTAGTMLDFETDTSPIEVTITASGDGESATHTVSVSINDVNEEPTISVADGTTPDGMAAASTVAENTMGALLGEITLGDPDAGQTHTLSTSDPKFVTKQDAEGGWWLALADDASLNFEDGAEVTVTVTVTDSGDPAMSASVDVTIMVTNVNEGPMLEAADGAVDENADGAMAGAVTASDPDAGDTHTYEVSDDRFEVADGMLKLKDGMMLDHEMEESVMVTITVTDAGGLTASADVTVTVNDVNEAAEVADVEIDDAVFVAGEENSMEVDLKAMFTDPDGDTLTYRLSDNAPDWLELSVTTKGTGDDQTIMGTISGTPPAGNDSSLDGVTIIASDAGGLEASSAGFDVVVDAENDAPSRVDLLVRDGELLERVREVTVKENVDGTELGMLRVRDVDDDRHPHGQHEYTFMVDGETDDRFEVTADGTLKLKDDKSLNYEDDTEFVLVITATDMAVGDDDDDTESATLRLTIKIGDVEAGDGPVAHRKIGDWWVVVDDDLDAEDVRAGDWLSFELDTTGSDAAFTDEDGDDLTYSIVSVTDSEGRNVNWLQISDSGRMTNKAEMVPERGVYTVTVRATDESDNSANASFMLAVALSDEDDRDNDRPDIRDVEEFDYTEGSGSRKVASFTVRDDDIGISPHPYGVLDVTWTAQQDGKTISPKYFMLEEVSRDEDSVHYEIWVKSDAELEKLKLKPLDHESGDEVDITVTVTDAPDKVGGKSAYPNVESKTDDKVITFDIEDADDEAPVFQRDAVDGGTATKGVKNSTTIAVDQQADKQVIVVQLSDAWDDDDTDDDDLEFDVGGTRDLPDWITVYGPDDWEEIVDRRDDVDEDDAPSGVRDNDQVVAIVIDRSARGDNVAQEDDFEFTLTAEDDDGNEATETIVIDVTDKNVDIASGDTDKVVSIEGNPSGSVPLTMKVNLGLDPDLEDADDAVLVVYTWSHDSATADTADDVTISVSSTPVPLPLVAVPAGTAIYPVGTKFTATVQYYEIDPETGAIVESDKYDDTTKASKELEASADPTSVMLDVTTAADGSGLSVTITAKGDAADSGGKARLETSTNGTSGWQAKRTVDADTFSGTSTVTLSVDADGDTTSGDGGGLYYRVVFVYEDDDDDEMEARSEVMQLGALADPVSGATTPIQGAATPVVGDNLRVNTSGNDADIQWQLETRPGTWTDIRGATDDELRVSSAHAGKKLRAKVTYTADDDPDTDADEEGWVVWVEYTEEKTVGGARENTSPTATGEDNEIEVKLGAMKGTNQPAKVVTFDASDLFFDTDSDELSYSITAVATDLDLTADATTTEGRAAELEGGLVYRVHKTEWDADDSEIDMTDDLQQSLVINQKTGEITYFTDLAQTHDGTDTDAAGNTLTFTISATDSKTGTTPATADVVVRINVAPTAINLQSVETDGTTAAGTAGDLPTPATPPAKAGTALLTNDGDDTDSDPDELMFMDDEENDRRKLADINVQDQNDDEHEFGTHEITLSGRGASMFEVRETDDSDEDGSTWEIWLKRDATFDFEALATAAEKTKAGAADATDADKTITLYITVTAKDMDGDDDGLSTMGVFTVKVMDEDTDDDPTGPTTRPTPDAPDPEVPGLEDDSDDDDQDGPVVPPPDDGGAFIDDLLDQFVISIDDIDIA